MEGGARGPEFSRITNATFICAKGENVLIAEGGATREVSRHMLLPWYEGLLLLEELVTSREGPAASEHFQASWVDQDLKTVLQKERAKFGGEISGATYMDRALVTTAVTGSRFVDSEGKEHAYRRFNLRADDAKLVDGEEGEGMFKVEKISGYMPPWEAFCHKRCGLYQDFYQVRWAYPFSEVDYGKVENGCSGQRGATWEPDECLPSGLDPIRLAAKRIWINKRREMERAVAAKATGEPNAADVSPSKASAAAGDVVDGEPPAKRAKDTAATS